MAWTCRYEGQEPQRINKWLAQQGVCSRREAEGLIAQGLVSIDGERVDDAGRKILAGQTLVLSDAAQAELSAATSIVLHKPVGYVSGQAEDGYEPAIVLIRPENRWAADPSPVKFSSDHLRGLAPAGRLDIDSTGLLVLTQDGRVAKQLIGENSSVEKEYLVRVEGRLSDEGLARLRHGLSLDGVKLKPAQVSWQNADQLRFVLREGRKRQIRRMCEMVGLYVTGLKRVRSGNVLLGALPVGQWRYLRPDEGF